MDIRALQYFLAIAREKSITKAAESLFMTQPPLSRQMKELEEELGKQLFIRVRSKISLTEEGKLLRQRAEEIISLMDKTVMELTSFEEKITGDVLIAAGETENISILANIGNSLNSQHPGIHYKIYSGDSRYVRDKLDNGLVDFGLVIGTVDIEKYNFIKLPVSDRWGVIMKKDDALAKCDSIGPLQLSGKPLLLSHQALFDSKIMLWLQKSGSVPNIVATYNLAFNASVFVKNGFGYMLAIDKVINTDSVTGLAFKPITPGIRADLFVIWKKNQLFGKAAQIFLEEIKKALD